MDETAPLFLKRQMSTQLGEEQLRVGPARTWLSPPKSVKVIFLSPRLSLLRLSSAAWKNSRRPSVVAWSARSEKCEFSPARRRCCWSGSSTADVNRRWQAECGLRRNCQRHLCRSPNILSDGFSQHSTATL